jgi:hypothetical protein
MKRPPVARPVPGSNKPTGYWIPYVLPKGERFISKPTRMVIDTVRTVPTLVSAVGNTDPYGPSTATLTFPGITLLDDPGEGDLWWLIGEQDVEIHWFDVETNGSIYQWEGSMQSFDWAENDTGNELVVTCQGAMLQLDSFLATPNYPYQPLPYELEIANQFQGRPSLRLAPMLIEFPAWWTRTYTKSYWDALALYRRPQKMTNGQQWTGMLTRNTGEFDPALQHIGNLLGSMFTDRGQFTLMLDKGRQPVLRHRERVESPNAATLVVDMLMPGVKVTSMTKDHSQKVNAVYASGTTIKGVTFNGMQVSPDGSRTWYEPYAYRREVEPDMTSNQWFDQGMMRREVNISFSEGSSEDEARVVAERHLTRYADAGLTGTLFLSVDPTKFGIQGPVTYPRQLVRAGMHIQIKNLFGRPDGVLFHITESTSDDSGTTMTLDSKFRDQLTVQEVRARGRDAQAPTRLLSINQYAPTQQDLLFPWSYTLGSGYVPRGSRSLFSGMPQDMEFPWEDWTRKRPPRDPVWAKDYIRIGPASNNADYNWALVASANPLDGLAHHVRLSQAGEAKLFQIAAYDRNGNIMQVPFHVSFYTNEIQVPSMPWMTSAAQAAKYPPYKKGQRYPFFQGAFEAIGSSGRVSDNWTNSLGTAGLMAGWGNYYEKAGYWPGSSSVTGAQPTGMLSLVNPGLSWNLTGEKNRVNLQASPEANLKNDNTGVADVRVMIYCDAQAAREVFFLGRIFRAEQTAK